MAHVGWVEAPAALPCPALRDGLPAQAFAAAVQAAAAPHGTLVSATGLCYWVAV
eukprot:COSAG01_NODE_40590_length_461_cov_45.563536_1_plen_53_part_01